MAGGTARPEHAVEVLLAVELPELGEAAPVQLLATNLAPGVERCHYHRQYHHHRHCHFLNISELLTPSQ